jgi:hypothetical protein
VSTHAGGDRDSANRPFWSYSFRVWFSIEIATVIGPTGLAVSFGASGSFWRGRAIRGRRGSA